MSETPLFFGTSANPLFGVLHKANSAADTGKGPRIPFVFCHPFGEEKLWTHRVFVSFARELARRGHIVLRFDFAGNGDSGGDFSQSSIDTALDDISQAIALARQHGDEGVGLLGLRLGATLASLAAARHADVRQLVLWAPIVDGGRYMQELLRGNLATQMAVYKEIREDREAMVESMKRGAAVNVDGYPLAYPLFEQASTIKLPAGNGQFAGRALIVQVDRRPNAPVAEELQRLGRSFTDASVVGVTEDAFWKEIDRFYETAPNLFAATLAWLDGQ